MEKFKAKKVVYLANAYSSNKEDPDEAALERHSRRALESYIGGKLKTIYGVTLILPIAISASMAELCSFGTGFEHWADDDYTFISKSDEVWVLLANGWDKSIGVRAEIKFAKENGIPVKYINKNTLELYDENSNDIFINEYLNDYKL